MVLPSTSLTVPIVPRPRANPAVPLAPAAPAAAPPPPRLGSPPPARLGSPPLASAAARELPDPDPARYFSSSTPPRKPAPGMAATASDREPLGSLTRGAPLASAP